MYTRYPRVLMGTLKREGSDFGELVSAAIKAGCLAFDTSPSYGTERALGKAIRHAIANGVVKREALYLQSKVDGWQMCSTNGRVRHHIHSTLNKLRIDYIDAVLIHWPFSRYLQATWEQLIELKQTGLILSVGLCNITIDAYSTLLDNCGVDADIIQLEISPLRQCDKELAYFRNHVKSVQAYSSLARMKREVSSSDILIGIAKRYNATVPEIILAWHAARDTSPIFTSGNPQRIDSNVKAVGLKLSESDVSMISSLDCGFKWFLDSYCCPPDYKQYSLDRSDNCVIK